MWCIYGLVDLSIGKIRYIGKTIVGPNKRLQGHIYNAQYGLNNHVYKWIRNINYNIDIVVLEECPILDHNYLNFAERFWIQSLREFGFELTNMTDGGQGGYGYKHSEESIDKMRISHTGLIAGKNHHFFGKKVSEERRKNISNGLKGKMAGEKNPMYGIKRFGENAPNFGKKHSEESKRKMSEAFKNKPSIANHTRWHVNRNIKRDGCTFCDNI